MYRYEYGCEAEMRHSRDAHKGHPILYPPLCLLQKLHSLASPTQRLCCICTQPYQTKCSVRVYCTVHSEKRVHTANHPYQVQILASGASPTAGPPSPPQAPYFCLSSFYPSSLRVKSSAPSQGPHKQGPSSQGPRIQWFAQTCQHSSPLVKARAGVVDDREAP